MIDLTVMNQQNRSISISLDSNSRTIYCSFGSNYSSNSISPNGSKTFRLVPGTYSIIAQGYNNKTYYMDLQPGNASMLVTQRYDHEPFNFLINQNGKSYYVGSYDTAPAIRDYNYNRYNRHSKYSYRKHRRNRYYCRHCRTYYTGRHRCPGSNIRYSRFGDRTYFSIGISNR